MLYVTFPGCWGAIIVGCLSFTPSLLPRGGLIQGVVCGITAAIGYGLGVLVASIWRAFADRGPRPPRRWAWPAFFIGGAVLFAVSFGLGQYWQYELRKLMGVTDYNVPLAVASPFIAALVFCLLLLIGRGVRGLYRLLAHLLDRWIGRRAAVAVGWIAVAGLVYVVITGLLLQGLVNVANSAFVLSGMVWLPFVTFWQVTADLPFSTGVPPGHGHTYTSEYVDGWNAVLRPAGITGQELADLRNIVADDK
jgi:uncharacterized membrane protein